LVMLEGENSVDGSALATSKGPSLSYGKPPSKAHHDDRWCNYCRKMGHTKDTCFRLHGKKKVFKRIGGFKGYASNKKGYKCYHPQSRRFCISKDVTFHGSKSFFPSSQLQGESIPEAEFLELSPFHLLQNFTSLEDNKDPESASLLEKNNEDRFFEK
ncbi:hypothetical protein S245_006824, partial [Arachis hypogaea]